MNRTKSFEKKAPILYLVAVPIGNLQEMTERAFSVIKESEVIFCEDTRNTGSLLSHFNIQKKLVSLREHNESSVSEKVIELLGQGKIISYVSDAGYPGISDPGKLLVKKVREAGYPVATVSGSSAFINALVSSSRETNHFYFHGFLDSGNKAKEELEGLKNKKETLIFYEAPHRIERTIKLLYEVLGNREATIARELTKLNEEYIEGNLEELINLDFNTIIGEIVIIVEGCKEQALDEAVIIKRCEDLLKRNISAKDVSDIVSYEFKVGKNYVYNLILNLKK